jgi:hypothetical protein
MPKGKRGGGVPQLREGDFDENLGKTVDTLIANTPDYVVYLDEDLYVEWAFRITMDLLPDVNAVLNNVSKLEAVSVSHLSEEQVRSFRRMLGEGVARALDGEAEQASEILAVAEQWIGKRNSEAARRWYLTSATIAALCSAIGGGLVWLFREPLIAAHGRNALEVLLGTSTGGLGAFLFLISRTRKLNIDSSAGRQIHYFEGALRVIAGVIGAFLVALSVKAELLLGFVQTSDNSLPVICVLCMAAGWSERLVPSIIGHVETTAESPGSQT